MDEKEKKYYETAFKITKTVICVSAAMVVVACAAKLVPTQKGILFKGIKGIGLYGLGLHTYDTMCRAIERNTVVVDVK